MSGIPFSGMMSRSPGLIRRGLLASVLGTLVLLSGCASLPAGHVADQRDPWERYNRAVFEFNDQVDRALIKPAAEIYRDYVPDLLQVTLRNFFGNLKDVATTVHQLLQGKPEEAGNAAARVIFNTTIGFLGLGDPASEMGYPKTVEDFGQTFGVWGAEPGPYFVLPLLGPSTVRDTVGTVLDFRLDPVDAVITDSTTEVVAYTSIALDRRVELLSAEDTLEALAFDRYMGVRNAFLARRRSQIFDGDPPPLPMKDE
jgi:phospholipid-binding lipoprotein MlaA